MKKENFITKDSSVFFATFSHYEKGKRLPRNGMVEPMLTFFLPRVKNFLLLDQPHPISDIINPVIEKYTGGKLSKKSSFSGLIYFPIYLSCKLPSQKRTRVDYKLRDFFSALIVCLIQKEKFDLFIGLEGINALAGIFLKKFGKVKKVIYYVSDYSPTRFGDTFFNFLYLWLDKYCVKNADFTWDVSSAMRKGRLEAGLKDKEMKRVIHVPNGLFPEQINALPFNKRDKNSLVYMGTLHAEFGVDLAIDSLIELKKKIPELKLRIIGGGKNLKELKDLVKNNEIQDSVVFYGFVESNEAMAEIVRNCFIGLAPYRKGNESSLWYAWYGDAGKIRQYLASGLPIVTTHVPPLGRIIVQKGAGILTQDNVKDFSEAILRLITDEKLYKKLSEKAEELSKENTWDNTYKNALKEMEDLITKLG